MKRKVKKKVIAKKKKQSPVYISRTRYILLGITAVAIFIFCLLLIKKINQPNPQDCANSLSCISDLQGNYDENNEGIFMGKKISGPPLAYKPHTSDFAEKITQSTVLGDTSSENKRIYVDLTKQKLYAFENNNLVHEFDVSTGKWWPTPTGDFRIWIKLRYTRMSGGNKADGTFYDLPNVPYTMFFYNDKVPKSKGYGIHGAYWHNNFGHPMSHGCINMREEDVAILYDWATPVVTKGTSVKATEDNPGTMITIYGETPKE